MKLIAPSILSADFAGLLPFEGKLEKYLRALMARPAAQAARFFDSLET